ncbi:hypothetical protein AYI68_g7949, partial [Smittium mucronatum]
MYSAFKPISLFSAVSGRVPTAISKSSNTLFWKQTCGYAKVKFSTKKNYEQEKLKFEKAKQEEKLSKRSNLPSFPALLAFMSLVLGGAIAYNTTKNFNDSHAAEFAALEASAEQEIKQEPQVETADAISIVTADNPDFQPDSAPKIAPSERYSPEDVAAFPFKTKKVIFVLGGPGSGKGTNSE